jgi:hypothetical protein
MIVLYLIHNSIYVLENKYLAVVIYIIFGFIISAYSLYKLILVTYEKESVRLKIEKINPAYTEYMPIFLAIAVIAFELNSFGTDNFSIMIISIFIYLLFYMSNIAYINPAWFLFGYRVYKIEKDSADYVLIMHKNENYKSIKNVKNIYKVDEYTFIKRKGK